MSLASTSIALAAESSPTVALSSTAVGGSSTSVTVIVNARTIWPAGVPKSVARMRTVYVLLAS